MAAKKQIQKKLFGGNVVKKRGNKSPNNKLNDLTGSEWTHFLCSVEVTNFPTSGKEGYVHKLRKQHPSPKPPQLMKQIIEFFTKKNQWVLDPFVGVGGTLLGCSLSNRRGVGVDLENNYLKIYQNVCKELAFGEQITTKADSRKIEENEARRKLDKIHRNKITEAERDRSNRLEEARKIIEKKLKEEEADRRSKEEQERKEKAEENRKIQIEEVRRSKEIERENLQEIEEKIEERMPNNPSEEEKKDHN